MCRLVCHEHNGVQTSINVKRPCWELPASVRLHLYMCVYKKCMHIYIYIIFLKMLESYSLSNQKALRELGTVPPRELGTVPPLGGPLSHYRNKGVWGFWCKHLVPISVFGFSVFSQLGTFGGFLFFFQTSSNPSFLKACLWDNLYKCFSTNTIKYLFKRNKNHWSLVAN